MRRRIREPHGRVRRRPGRARSRARESPRPLTPSTAPSKSTMARCTFRRKRRSASRVTPRWCTCATTPTASCSTWAARHARFRRRFAAPWPRATRAAAFRAARPADATRITCEHWADGGATSLDNLVLLCRRHHRAVHEGGFGVIRGRDGALTFLRPDGAPLQVAPARRETCPGSATRRTHVIGTPPTWDGTPFDLPWAIDVLYRPRSGGCPPEGPYNHAHSWPSPPAPASASTKSPRRSAKAAWAQVYRAHATRSSNREVAIKVLPDAFAARRRPARAVPARSRRRSRR